MAAAAVSALACPLRRSSRLTSRQRSKPDIDIDDDTENELTPRALRALKRQRLALDLVPLPPRPKRRRKEHLPSPSPLPDPTPDSTPSSPEPLTPLTPLSPSPSPSPESSPSPPGHDRHSPPPSPPHDPLPPPPQHIPTDHVTPPTPLDPTLDTLIPFDALHPHFHPDLSVQIPPQPQLQAMELQDQFHSFPQPPLYVPPPVFVRDREINIWKLACQERVDCLLRRYGIDYIKALVQSEARSHSGTPSQTKFRLYTPASYTYSSTAWGSTSTTRTPFPLDDDDPEAAWPIDDADWADADVDMEDDDDDDYEDEDDAADTEAVREGESTLDAVHGLVVADTSAIQVDPTPKPHMMEVDASSLALKPAALSEAPLPPRPPPSPSPSPSTINPAPRPLTPTPVVYPSLTPPSLPPLSSLHVPLLSEPPRAFMGRGTPPDRRRLIEWSGSGRFATNGMGPPLYLSPVPQRHPGADVGIVPMSVDATPPPSHSNGEWTSFLFSVLEGDGVGVGVGTGVSSPPHASGPAWYELGLGAVPTDGLELPLSHSPTRTPVEEGNNSSSTLRFALG